MANVFVGQVTGLCAVTGAGPYTEAAYCRAVLNGRLTFDAHNIRKIGVGGQLHVRKGTTECTLEATIVGPALADLQLFWPTTAGVQVASFTQFYVEADDGVNGVEIVLTDCQPATIRAACSGEPDSEVEYHIVVKAATIADGVVGTYDPVYNDFLGHTVNDITVTYAAAAQGTLSWELTNDLGTTMFNPMDGKTPGSKTLPDGYVTPVDAPRMTCVTSNKFKMDDWDTDNWTPEDIIVALANGTGAQDIDFTLDSWVPEIINQELESENISGFAHEFAPGDGTTYGRVTLS